MDSTFTTLTVVWDREPHRSHYARRWVDEAIGLVIGTGEPT